MSAAHQLPILIDNPYAGHPGLSSLQADVLWEYAKTAALVKQVRRPSVVVVVAAPSAVAGVSMRDAYTRAILGSEGRYESLERRPSFSRHRGRALDSSSEPALGNEQVHLCHTTPYFHVFFATIFVHSPPCSPFSDSYLGRVM